MTDKLYPCRFCGREPIYNGGFGSRCLDTGEYDFEPDHVYCIKCGQDAYGSHFDFTQYISAKDQWQARNEKHNPFIEEINAKND